MKNYYQILGVSEDASNDQIKKAFKDIAKKEHPDRGGDEAKFKEANEAYDKGINPKMLVEEKFDRIAFRDIVNAVFATSSRDEANAVIE